ncbi:HlyD family secretion protein [Salegentibacter echinorum]|uniref:HlyD family secretion protein n=1 Tax=Salegentibacter echinorum TaxID=1073325 RepID=A0A1M5BPX6_SALEC|nr:biotin/lipoyl-binding protein [Salegentibacter echinorum]SHF44461.1 HlyD family secretion protein [Salegentibacter echinorum]
MKIKNSLFLAILVVFAACSDKKIEPAFMGKIERTQISVVTKVPGTVEKILVSKGDLVKKGDTLAILDIPEVDAKKQQAEGAFKSAEAQYQMAQKGATSAQLRQLQNKVNGLKEQFEFAQKSKNRLEKMLQDSLIPQQQFDEVYAKYQGARNQYEAAKTELEEARTGGRLEQQTMALGQQLQASGAISEVDAAEREKYMTAPQDMSVETINLEIGELALVGYPVFSGYVDQSVYFRFTIAESKLGEIKPGKKVKIKVLYKDTELIDGEVVMVKALSSYANIATAYPDFDMQQALFEVEVQPTNPEEVRGLITKASVSLELDK